VSRPLTSATTYVGIGYVKVSYALTGAAANLFARLWDVAPDGQTLLIDRGAYRFDVPRYDQQAGTIRLPLFGNHYQVSAGHELRLDLTQVDRPTFQMSNVPSSIRLDPPTLVLPIAPSR
jgi:predicted acyl esterase